MKLIRCGPAGAEKTAVPADDGTIRDVSVIVPDFDPVTLDGERVQDGTAVDMIFPVAEIVSYLSSVARSTPGDLICAGTPAGVGAGFDPPRFLRPGGVVRLGGEALGEQRQRVTAA